MHQPGPVHSTIPTGSDAIIGHSACTSLSKTRTSDSHLYWSSIDARENIPMNLSVFRFTALARSGRRRANWRAAAREGWADGRGSEG